MSDLTAEAKKKLFAGESLEGLDELFFRCGLCGKQVSGFCIGTQTEAVGFILMGVELTQGAQVVKDSMGRPHFVCRECLDE